MWWRSWLRHCATSQKVKGLIPDGVTGIFHWHNPYSCTTALRLTQPLTEMSTRNISWSVKAASAQGWPPYHLHVPTVLKSGSINLLEPSGPVQACNGIALPLPVLLQTESTKAIGWPEGLCQWKPPTTLGNKPMTFWLLPQCLKPWCHSMPHFFLLVLL
jgi:hypothetical protein